NSPSKNPLPWAAGRGSPAAEVPANPPHKKKRPSVPNRDERPSLPRYHPDSRTESLPAAVRGTPAAVRCGLSSGCNGPYPAAPTDAASAPASGAARRSCGQRHGRTRGTHRTRPCSAQRLRGDLRTVRPGGSFSPGTRLSGGRRSVLLLPIAACAASVCALSVHARVRLKSIVHRFSHHCQAHGANRRPARAHDTGPWWTDSARGRYPISSSRRTMRAALSTGDSKDVSTTTSGCSGSSYGSDTPVNAWISPAKAFLYRPLTSRRAHTASGHLTYTSTKSPISRRARSRASRYGEFAATTTTTPWRASSLATYAMRCTLMSRSSRLKPSPWLRCRRTSSPSRISTSRPRQRSSRASSSASVDLPAPDKPVSHTTNPRSMRKPAPRRFSKPAKRKTAAGPAAHSILPG